MSISLNNHESRISNLEKSDGGWSYVSNARGYCLTHNPTGIKIQWGVFYLDDAGGDDDARHMIYFTESFKSLNYGFSMIPGESSRDPICSSWSTRKTDHIKIDVADMWYRQTSSWIAIGILYTYRYIIKSAQKFTPLSYLF